MNTYTDFTTVTPFNTDLSDKDIQHLQQLDSIYIEYRDFFLSQLKTVKQKTDSANDYIQHDRTRWMAHVAWQVEYLEGHLKERLKALTENFISRVTGYFTDNYLLNVPIFVLYHTVTVANVYEVIAHIMKDCPQGLKQAAKDITTRKLRQNFRRKENTPKLQKGGKVILPNTCKGRESAHVLLAALSLYFSGSTVLTEELQRFFDSGKYKSEDKEVIISERLTYRCYLNYRVDLTFSSQQDAEHFFRLFDLANPGFID